MFKYNYVVLISESIISYLNKTFDHMVGIVLRLLPNAVLLNKILQKRISSLPNPLHSLLQILKIKKPKLNHIFDLNNFLVKKLNQAVSWTPLLIIIWSKLNQTVSWTPLLIVERFHSDVFEILHKFKTMAERQSEK